MSHFAPIHNDLSFWQKQATPLFPDLAWNLPEQKVGHILIAGGNSQSFSNVIRTSEFLTHTFPVRQVTTLLPDALRSQLPSIAGLDFAPSTSSGSFAKSRQLEIKFEQADFSLLIGDLSKNAETAIAINDAIRATTHPFILARDTVDLLAPTANAFLSNDQAFITASMAQLQKIFRAVYYPRMLMLSQPLVAVVETLHKFTLTYPVTILTYHQDQIIVAHAGNITTTHIVDTDYSPIMLWSGQLAAKIAAFNLFNPHKHLEATTAAILYK